MTEATNIQSAKSKVMWGVVSLFLALLVAAAIQSAAVAKPASAPSTSRASVEAGQPKHETETKRGRAVKDTGFSTKGSFINPSSGRAGTVAWSPIHAQGYYNANHRLAWDATIVDRAPTFTGTQYINVTHKIYKWNKITGKWQYLTNRGYTVRTPYGYHAVAAGSDFQYYSRVEEYYFVDVQVTWRTQGGGIIAQRTIRTTNGADYRCVFSRGMCDTGGTENLLVWIQLFH